ncbi:MAG: SLC13/DASS family transporter [Parvularculaceae bacterium]|nr:SLC13/DASS family transporter [Parvularculaceae bacterium]
MKWARIIGGLGLAAIGGAAAYASGLSEPVAWTIAVTTLTAAWWVTEAIPIPATSLIPFAAFPMAGVLTDKEAASALGDHVIVLLMGAFMLSKGLEKSGAHERLALTMIRLVGSSGKRLVAGFMIASAMVSMWVSNTATTLMLMPIALAVLARAEDRSLDVPIVLGVAYAASIGGLGTLIGTPPNVIFAGIYERTAGVEYGFTRWMATGVPVVAVAIHLSILWLTRRIRFNERVAIPDPGAWTAAEVRTLIVFGVTVLLWVTRSEPFGGWSQWFGVGGAGDSTVALLAVAAMFFIPDGKGGALLDWKWASDIPWGMLLLFAGGICIAIAFEKSGLSVLIGNALGGARVLHPFALMLVVCLVVTFMSELTSNTAVATLVLPVLAAVADGTGMAPAILMVPAAMAASSGFMLPVSTAPNAIAYGTGRVSVGEMAREGFALNIMLALVIASVCYFFLS